MKGTKRNRVTTKPHPHERYPEIIVSKVFSKTLYSRGEMARIHCSVKRTQNPPNRCCGQPMWHRCPRKSWVGHYPDFRCGVSVCEVTTSFNYLFYTSPFYSFLITRNHCELFLSSEQQQAHKKWLCNRKLCLLAHCVPPQRALPGAHPA